ncbi:mitochondrial carrier domain-containing protein [Fusarium oxysporum]|nr:mitochondrial carrier domain-containing protein [Fusarium oxysporum]
MMNEPKQQPPLSLTRENVPFEALAKHESRQESTSARASRTKQPFWLGGAAAAGAALFTHPLDLVKARLQHSSAGSRTSMLSALRQIWTVEGPRGVYSGLSAALLRQLTYSSVRLGVYEKLKAQYSQPSFNGDGSVAKPSMDLYIFQAAIAGVLGGIAGNPADVVNLRMQTDAALPPAQRRGYASVFHGMASIIREEGLSGMFRGLGSNVSRAALMTASQIGSYDIFKAACLEHLSMKDGTGTHLIASTMAGLTATTVCSPVDVIKTRVMTSTNRASIGSVLTQAWRQEGFSWAFKGWTPSFMRLGPQTVLTMVFLEQLKALYR